MSLNLEQSIQLCRLLADSSRLRLMLLLENHELSVAELTEITGLAQSRVSTHLAKLRRAQLVEDRRIGAAAIYSAVRLDSSQPTHELWLQLRSRIDDTQLELDEARALEVIAARKPAKSWAESVAGRMDLHYSPGRTWEATARSLIGLLELGHVLDIAAGDGVLADLIAEHTQSVTCVDISHTVLEAARTRLQQYPAVRFLQADMHALPLASNQFDHVFAMHALAYSDNVDAVLQQAARVLKPGGRLILAALAPHQHETVCSAYDHRNLGIEPKVLASKLGECGLKVEECRVRSRETRPPYFEVIAARALKPQSA